VRLTNVSLVCNGDTWKEWKRKEFERNLLDAERVPALPTNDTQPSETEDKSQSSEPTFNEEEIDLNWTYWNLKVDSIDLKISLWQFLDGNGLVKSAVFKGVRGKVDREHIVWAESWLPVRRSPEIGDFDLDGCEVQDLMLTVKNPHFRPYTLSIFRAEMPRLRKQWMLYDMMTAESAVGMFDNCLFSLHKPQAMSTAPHDNKMETQWSKMRHFKMNALPIDHVNAYSTGPVSWITKGTVDIDMHVLFPASETDEDMIDQILDEIDGIRDKAINKFEKVIAEHQIPITSSATPRSRLKQLRKYGTQFPHVPEVKEPKIKSELLIFSKIQLNDLKASVPLSVPQLSYMTNALIRYLFT
jgi:mitochondrial distribution and morphology protein 31